MSSPLGSSSNLVITLGVFLKILGFFVILYSYSEFVPNKVTQAEQSLQQRFSINITLPGARSGEQAMSLTAVQGNGRAYDNIEKDLKTQIDLFSTEYRARGHILALRLPADQVLDLDGQPAKSPTFDKTLVQTLKKNEPKNMQYRLTIIGGNGQAPSLMRGLGDFAQRIVADDYPEPLVTIGYDDKMPTDKPTVEFRVEAVPK